MTSRILAPIVFLFTLISPTAAVAQPSSWVQIEAHPTLQDAQAHARLYGADLPDIAGYRLTSGWYALALGPYADNGAAARMEQLRGSGRIPMDSFISDGGNYGAQFWPMGATAATTPPAAAAPQTPASPVATLIDETPAEARQSEALLDRDGRVALQAALQWEGYYTAALDGAIGPGTRRAMAAYQSTIAAEPTGILTTAQRAKLLEGYQTALSRLGMAPVQDMAAGIEIDLPMGLIMADTPLSPFSRYTEKDSSGVTVMLISQTGDQVALAGLYELMQTVEIVPLNGTRKLGRRDFLLTGQDETVESYTYAALADGAIKGFTLTWRPEDRSMMTRVAELMRASFTPIKDAVLPSTAGRENQSIDLFAGLEIRRPEASYSGVFVDARGSVLTTNALNGCARITVGDEAEATITAVDDALGLALLQPSPALSPLGVADFRNSAPLLQSEVALSGFSFGDLLSAPAVTYGRLADLQGLQGEKTRARLELSALPGDIGGPVLDTGGAVIGVLLAKDDTTRQLPDDVRFAAPVPAIASFLQVNGVKTRLQDPTAPIAPEELSLKASDMTVLVSCWN